MKIAILGDSHIPGRTPKIPPKLLAAVAKFKPERIVFTGDATTMDFLKIIEAIAPLYAVKGHLDFLELPANLTFEAGGVAIAVVHGHQVTPAGNHVQLENLAHYFGAKILVSGHTHKADVFKGERALLLNPGSCTGTGLGGTKYPPSIMLFAIDEGKVALELIELRRERGEEVLIGKKYQTQFRLRKIV